MKKLLYLTGILLLMPSAALATTVTIDDQSQPAAVQTVETVQANPPAAVVTTTTTTDPAIPAGVYTTTTTERTVVIKETPVVVVREDNPREFEGEVISVSYKPDRLQIRDATGRDRRVDVKPGMINNYKRGDYVRVQMMVDNREAKMINVIKNVSLLDGRVIGLDPAGNQIIVRDASANDRTVVVAPGMANNFRTGERVRIYLIPG